MLYLKGCKFYVNDVKFMYLLSILDLEGGDIKFDLL